MKCGLTVVFLLHALSLFICRWVRLLSLLFYINNFVASFYFCTGRPCAYFNISLFTFFHIIFEITAICLSRLATPASWTFFPLLDCLCDCSCMELDETQECHKVFLREYWIALYILFKFSYEQLWQFSINLLFSLQNTRSSQTNLWTGRIRTNCVRFINCILKLNDMKWLNRLCSFLPR